MACTYVNPTAETKEMFLERCGRPITREEVMNWNLYDKPEELPVIYTSTETFASVLVVCSRHCQHYATQPDDHRPKAYFAVKRELLTEEATGIPAHYFEASSPKFSFEDGEWHDAWGPKDTHLPVEVLDAFAAASAKKHLQVLANLPRSKSGLIAAGYTYVNEGLCPGCGSLVTWYKLPTGERVALNSPSLTHHQFGCWK